MLDIYKAQTVNVQALATARKVIRHALHEALIKKDETQVRVFTNVLCVIFSFWAEVRFSKLIHTPYGFTEDEVETILSEGGRERSVEARWMRCIGTALSKVPASRRTNEIPNCKLRLEKIIQRFVVKPSQLRNKIAHGQWHTALNRDQSGINEDTTDEIGLLDLIEIDLWFDVFEQLAQIVENIVESPEKAHRRDYWVHVTNIEAIIAGRKNWTTAGKQARLIEKRQRGIQKFQGQIADRTR